MAQPRNQDVPRSDTGRAEAFSDAVFAIVITLLVLDLKPPTGAPGTLLAGLLSQWPTYLAYVTSYLYIAVVWLNHKATFTRIKIMDRGLHWANLGVLFTTALLPWPTAVLSSALARGNPADSRVAVALYALIGAAMCLAWLVLFHHLGRHPELTEEEVPDRFFVGERGRAMAGTVLYAVAGVVGALVEPVIALVVFLALPLFYGITSHGLTTLPPAARRILPPH